MAYQSRLLGRDLISEATLKATVARQNIEYSVWQQYFCFDVSQQQDTFPMFFEHRQQLGHSRGLHRRTLLRGMAGFGSADRKSVV